MLLGSVETQNTGTFQMEHPNYGTLRKPFDLYWPPTGDQAKQPTHMEPMDTEPPKVHKSGKKKRLGLSSMFIDTIMSL
jgi:hypothetical protein